MTTLYPGTLVTRLSGEPGIWRIVSIEERTYGPRDYLPLGARLGDPAPPLATLERALAWDFTPPRSEGRAQRPRRALSPLASLRPVSRGELRGLISRVEQVIRLLPPDEGEML